ncbi:MAG: hypothetical protein HY613_01935 [Candidatus Rokubacteria bacterium]|nr:hypothetical protein [Candidatus Rokubacteria bacterium]
MVQTGPKGWVISRWPVVAWLVILLWAPFAGAAGIPAPERDHRSGQDDREAHLAAVRSVLASKTTQPVVPQRMERKLSAASDEQLRLIGSLAERIADSKPTVAADIALLLLTVLIVTL